MRSRRVIFIVSRRARGCAPADRVILPWEAVHSNFTQDCYQRRSRQFLVFSGYMDPALWNHANPTRRQVEAEEQVRNGIEYVSLW